MRDCDFSHDGSGCRYDRGHDGAHRCHGPRVYGPVTLDEARARIAELEVELLMKDPANAQLVEDAKAVVSAAVPGSAEPLSDGYVAAIVEHELLDDQLRGLVKAVGAWLPCQTASVRLRRAQIKDIYEAYEGLPDEWKDAQC